MDIGIAFDPVAGPGLQAQTLARSRFVVLAPQDASFPVNTPLKIEELADHRFIGLNNRGPLGQLLSTKLATSNVNLNVVAWTETYHVARALVAFGAGISIADEITARSSTGGDIKVIPLEPALEFDIRALHLSSTPLSLLANHFVDHLQATIVEFLR